MDTILLIFEKLITSTSELLKSNIQFEIDINDKHETINTFTDLLKFYHDYNELLKHEVYDALSTEWTPDSNKLRSLFLKWECVFQLILSFIVNENDEIKNYTNSTDIKYKHYEQWISNKNEHTDNILHDLIILLNENLQTQTFWNLWQSTITIKESLSWKNDFIDYLVIEDLTLLGGAFKNDKSLNEFINEMIELLKTSKINIDDDENNIIKELDRKSLKDYLNVRSDITKVQYTIILNKIQNYLEKLNSSIEYENNIYHERFVHYQEILKLLRNNFQNEMDIRKLKHDMDNLNQELKTVQEQLSKTNRKLQRLEIIKKSLHGAFELLQKRLHVTQKILPRQINIIADDLPDVKDSIDKYKTLITEKLQSSQDIKLEDTDFDDIQQSSFPEPKKSKEKIDVPFTDDHDNDGTFEQKMSSRRSSEDSLLVNSTVTTPLPSARSNGPSPLPSARSNVSSRRSSNDSFYSQNSREGSIIHNVVSNSQSLKNHKFGFDIENTNKKVTMTMDSFRIDEYDGNEYIITLLINNQKLTYNLTDNEITPIYQIDHPFDNIIDITNMTSMLIICCGQVYSFNNTDNSYTKYEIQNNTCFLYKNIYFFVDDLILKNALYMYVPSDSENLFKAYICPDNNVRLFSDSSIYNLPIVLQPLQIKDTDMFLFDIKCLYIGGNIGYTYNENNFKKYKHEYLDNDTHFVLSNNNNIIQIYSNNNLHDIEKKDMLNVVSLNDRHSNLYFVYKGILLLLLNDTSQFKIESENIGSLKIENYDETFYNDKKVYTLKDNKKFVFNLHNKLTEIQPSIDFNSLDDIHSDDDTTTEPEPKKSKYTFFNRLLWRT